MIFKNPMSIHLDRLIAAAVLLSLMIVEGGKTDHSDDDVEVKPPALGNTKI